EHGFEKRLSQLNRRRVTANSAKHAKLAHQTTISCIEVPVCLNRGLPLLTLRSWRHWGSIDPPFTGITREKNFRSADQHVFACLVAWTCFEGRWPGVDLRPLHRTEGAGPNKEGGNLPHWLGR